MSVFESIKAGILSFTSRDAGKDEPSKYSKSPVNLEAGAELLHKYQTVWKEIHQGTEDNARRAEDVAVQITNVYVKYDRQYEVMGTLHESLAALPVILNKLQDLTDVLACLEEEYDKVEASLVHLEDLCEWHELQCSKIVDCQKLATYESKKLNELEKVRVQLAKDHAKKAQSVEKKRQTNLKERQNAFQDAFEDDIDYFRTHGRVERVSVSSTESGKRADLSEVAVEDDMNDLDEFLASVEITPSTEDVSVPLSSEQSDDIFIEEGEGLKVTRSSEDLDPDEYFEDELEATHGDFDNYQDSEDVTEESDVEKPNDNVESKDSGQVNTESVGQSVDNDVTSSGADDTT